MPRKTTKLSEFGKCLRKLRVDYDLSQSDLAARLCCSAAYLSGIEAGNKQPSDALVALIGGRMGLSAIERAQLKKAADSEKRYVTINLAGMPAEVRAAVVAFARSMPTDEAEIARLAWEIYSASGG